MMHLPQASRTSLKIVSAPGRLSLASSSEEDIETAAQVCILGAESSLRRNRNVSR